MKKLFFLFAFLPFITTAQTTYEIKQAKQEKVIVDSAGKYISVDYTVEINVILNGEVIAVIGEGPRIDSIPLKLGEGIPAYANDKIQTWFRNKYKW